MYVTNNYTDFSSIKHIKNELPFRCAEKRVFSRFKEFSSKASLAIASLFLGGIAAEKSIEKADEPECVIKPKLFPIVPRKAKTLYELYPQGYEHFDSETLNFTHNANPLIIPKLRPTNEKRAIYVSNFDKPMGTIAASTTLDKTIYTDNMYSCAAMTIVDRSQNLQTLVHVYPGYGKHNKSLLRYIISHSDTKNLEISIIPGSLPITGSTVSFLIDTVKDIASDSKLTLCNFPQNDIDGSESDYYINIRNRAVVLNNGNITCCNSDDIYNRKVNPKSCITYFDSL